jgi:hypothetical protein
MFWRGKRRRMCLVNHLLDECLLEGRFGALCECSDPVRIHLSVVMQFHYWRHRQSKSHYLENRTVLSDHTWTHRESLLLESCQIGI